MLGNEVHDYRQLKAVKHKLETPEYWGKKLLFKSLYYCGSKVPVRIDGASVALVANNKTARFVGNSSCKSSWCCPVCTARQMSKYAAKIASALDALKERSLRAAMFTFTIPHTSGFTCEQSTEILYKTWKAFTVHGNKPAETYKNDIFANFMGTFNSKHRVRVAEYTWGKKGWHPHFHCLFWFPENRINEILEWEDRLNERWLELCKRYTIREILIGYPETQRKTVRAQVETRVKIMYENLNSGSKGVYISKSDGKVIVQKSSQYLCGWGGDKELTGNFSAKASHEGHYTWQQILENAINSELKPAEGARKKEVSEDAAQATDWWKLYFEYAEATRKQRHARVNFSVHSGISKIIEEYRKTEGYKTILKKNVTSQVEKFGVWRTIGFFNTAQWREICFNDLEPQILELATANNAKELIDKLLEKYRIPPLITNKRQAEKIEAILNAA